VIRKASATSGKAWKREEKQVSRGERNSKDEEMGKDERDESAERKRGKEARSVLRTSEISEKTGFWFVLRNVTQLNRPERRN